MFKILSQSFKPSILFSGIRAQVNNVPQQWISSSSTHLGLGMLPSMLFGTLRSFSPRLAVTSTQPGCSPLPIPWNELSSPTTSTGPLAIQTRGLKIKGRVKRRCRDCYQMYIQGIRWNLCRSKPRHKAKLKPPYYVNQRILTLAMSSPKREW